ncbi:lipase family alpha/beta hydrolase [Parachitinimonas caeni]|uniref:Triacylglycerol lipase n=1 Tax=Parachitinimonas caeni TaxID=3031301 RepID=A0ABT7DW65_9NEIS|nr:triacylglycerol lipase [Parachitinimonas caeni]MDK2124310.1 triacylglycerol lipase [Parachitinimonas caeni]
MKKLRLSAAIAALCVSASVWAGNGYTETRYPVVLVHGLFGFDKALGVDYFYRVPGELQAGGTKVFLAQVSATNSTEERGEQLLQQVKKVLAITGATKVNLIGHSHGGPTIRYVAGVAPQLVASVTSVAGVNKGSKVADLVRGTLPPGSVSEGIAAAAAKALSTIISLASGGSSLPQDPLAALGSLTTQGTAAFNRKFPQGLPTTSCGEGASYVNGVYYASWSGTKPYTNFFDPLDAPLGVLGLVHGEANDGLVSACSSHLGKVIKDNYKMNHADEINHTFGLRDLFETDPVTVYRQTVNQLKMLGL